MCKQCYANTDAKFDGTRAGRRWRLHNDFPQPFQHWAATPELTWWMERTTTLAERLFALMILGDQPLRGAPTHVLGEVAWRRG